MTTKKFFIKLIPGWVKIYWKDPAFRLFTYALLTVGPIWDGACTLVNFKVYYEQTISVGTTILCYIVLLFMYLFAYLKRNEP